MVTTPLALNYLIGAFGLILLSLGGELLVRSCINISKLFKVSASLISTILIGFGTSTPELMVSVKAALYGESELAVANVVGSNTANILLILGLSALIYPLQYADAHAFIDLTTLLLVTCSLLFCARCGRIWQLMGIALCTSLLIYLFATYLQQHRNSANAPKDLDNPQDDPVSQNNNVWLTLLMCFFTALVGLFFLVYGAEYLVNSAIQIAQSYNVSKRIIGLSLVAVGTSLPELATAVIASIKKEGQIVIANVLGSNIFNSTLIIGLPAIIKPITIQPHIIMYDIPMMTITTVMLILLMQYVKKIDRKTGLIFLILYAAYMKWTFAN